MPSPPPEELEPVPELSRRVSRARPVPGRGGRGTGRVYAFALPGPLGEPDRPGAKARWKVRSARGPHQPSRRLRPTRTPGPAPPGASRDASPRPGPGLRTAWPAQVWPPRTPGIGGQ